MTGNYDITIKSASGSITFFGSKLGDDDWSERITGYKPPLIGLGDPGRRTTSTDKQGSDGGLVVASDQNYDMRQISIDAFAMCESFDDIKAITNQIRLAMPIREEVLILVDTPQGERYGAYAVVTKCSPSIAYSKGNMLLRDYDIDILAPDSSWYDYTNANINSANINKQVPGGLKWLGTGASWLSNGLKWNSGSGNTVIVNNGSETVYPSIIISGVVHNPTVTNLSTGLGFKINVTTSSTDVIEINMDSETVTLNRSSIINNINTENWWGLLPGTNTISYETSMNDDTAEVVMKWRNRYMEII